MTPKSVLSLCLTPHRANTRARLAVIPRVAAHPHTHTYVYTNTRTEGNGTRALACARTRGANTRDIRLGEAAGAQPAIGHLANMAGHRRERKRHTRIYNLFLPRGPARHRGRNCTGAGSCETLIRQELRG